MFCSAISLVKKKKTSMKSLISLMQHYSTRKKYEGEYCYDLSIMEKFLNEKTVKDALGVMDIRFDLCNKNVSIAL